MISLKPLLLAFPLSLISFSLMSCQQNTEPPTVVVRPGIDHEKIRQQNLAQAQAEAKAKVQADARASRLAEKQRLVRDRAAKREAEIASTKTTFKAPDWRESIAPKPKKTVKKYRVASPISGKPGYVFNPYTYQEVYVRGLRSGSVVVDPNDPAGREHAFQLP